MRKCSVARRRLEFEIILGQVKKDKERFIARLERNIRREGDCIIWRGRKDTCGYGHINFRHHGKHHPIAVHRLFLILRLCSPIPAGYEAGHTCGNRACVKHVQLQTWQHNMKMVHDKQATGL